MRLLDGVSMSLEAEHRRIQCRGMIVGLVRGNPSRTWVKLVHESVRTVPECWHH